MQPLAPGVSRFRFVWPYAFNAYLIETASETVVVDASTRWDWWLMRNQLRGKKITGMMLTHAHPDHQGCAAKICRTFQTPLLCHEADADSAEGKAPLVRQNPFWEIVGNMIWAGPRSPVSRRLREGEQIAGFRVIHMPGHTAGQVALFRQADRVAIVGDVINTNDYVTGMLSLIREPPRTFSVNPSQNRDSIRRLASLNPCPGHGPPLRNMQRFHRFAQNLPK